jgi:DNA-binding beta-propeller fold protein YncE
MRSLRPTPHTRRVVAVLISSLALISAVGAMIALPAAGAAARARQPGHRSRAAIASRAPARQLAAAFTRSSRFSASGAVQAGAAAERSFGTFSDSFGFRSALVGSAPVGSGPDFTAVDPATHTLYVTNGFNENGNPDGGNTVSVIDVRHCQADDVSRCKGPWPTLTVGSDPNADPSAVTIDQQTDTLYVADASDNTVAVFNGATCNAETSAGCGQTPAMVPVGMLPVAIFDDPANNTVYIPDGIEDDVSMLDSATCKATDLAACPTTPPPTVTVPSNPVAGAVDRSTHTVYVTVCGDPNFGCPAGPNGVSVFDASTCNATVQSGCDQLGLLPTAMFPSGAEVDPANQTLYTADGDNTISAFDLRNCNAADLAGCATDTPGTVTLPPGLTLWVAVDPANHTVYVTSQKDDSVAVVNANVCNGSDLAGCATLDPPEIHTGADPEVLTLDPDTQTLYTANQVDNDVSVINASLCDAQTTSGCRQGVPEVPNVSGGLAADPAVHTTYVASGANLVSMIDTSACNAFHASGCSATPPTVTVGTYPSAVALDPTTHTVYVANAGSGSTGTVSVFDDRSCNATDQAGCAAVETLQVPGGNPFDVAVDSATDTIYVATITASGPDLISVFNGATCNATNTRDCNQTPATVAVGSSGDAPNNSSLELAVNPATNTIYASNIFNTAFFEPPPYLGNSVYVINGATCDAADMSCGQTPAAVTLASNPPVGSNPVGIAVDQATDTIYTANLADGETAGTVSVINGAICNGHDPNGCGQTPATAPAGFGAIAIAIDQLTNQVYAANIEDTSVTTINGATCNGTNATSCDDTRTDATVGDNPSAISVDPAVDTAYVADTEGVSVIPLNH